MKPTHKYQRITSPIANETTIISQPSHKSITDLDDGHLSKIFVYVASDVTSTESLPALTHVSRRWRRIALAHPRLWDTIKLKFFDSAYSAPWVEHLVSRTGENALELDCSIYWPAQWQKQEECVPHLMQVLKMLSPEMHRVKSIRLDVDNSGMHKVINFYRDFPAPEVLELYLSVTRGRTLDIWQEREPALFNGVHPKLTTLHLSGCWLDWAMWKPILPNLRRLSIVRPPIADKMRLNDAIIMNVLKMPYLEYLELDDALHDIPRSCSNTASTPLKLVRLEFGQLKELRINAPTAALCLFLEASSVPRVSRFKFTFYKDVVEGYLPYITLFFKKFSSRDPRPIIRHMDLIFDQQSVQIIGRSFDPFYYSNQDENLIFSATFKESDPISSEVIEQTLRNLPIWDVEVLRIQELTRHSISRLPVQIFFPFRQLPKLHTFHLCNSTRALRMLSTKFMTNDWDVWSWYLGGEFTIPIISSDSRPIPFPALSTVVVQDVDFGNEERVDSLDALRSFLAERTRDANAVRTLVIIDCVGQEGDINLPQKRDCGIDSSAEECKVVVLSPETGGSGGAENLG